MSCDKKTAFIFAAGLGTRLQPITLNKPKALVEIKGQTLLEIAIEKIQKAGFQRIVINTHHFAEQIEEFVESRAFDVEIILSHERDKLLDTGGGLYAAKEWLGEKPFLAYNVDIQTDLDLREFYESHEEEALSTLFVSDRKSSRCLLFDEAGYMVGWRNQTTGEVRTPFDPLCLEKCNGLAFNGIHIISPKIFSIMDGWKMPFSITDFYISSCDKYKIKAYKSTDVKVVDVGKIDILNQFNE